MPRSSKRQKREPSPSLEASENSEEESEEEGEYTGPRDKSGKPHGKGTLVIDEFCTFIGKFKHGVKEGPGKFEFSDGSYMEGTLKDDALEGEGTYCWSDGSYVKGFYVEGELNGRGIEYDEEGNVAYDGMYKDNVRNGAGTLYLEDGASMTGEFLEGQFHGKENVYHYDPRLWPTARLEGCWEDGKLESAVFKCDGVVLQDNKYVDALQFAGANGKNIEKNAKKAFPSFSHDRSSKSHLSHTPLVRDPYEAQLVYVKQSTAGPDAGEGLFARVDLPAGIICSFYNGVRITQPAVDRRPWDDNSNTITLEEENNSVLDIPKEWATEKTYRASLGHKCNHTFDNDKLNAMYDHFFHPRFDRIKCIRTIKEIKKGEEIFVTYGYGARSGPNWYREARKAFEKEKKKRSRTSSR